MHLSVTRVSRRAKSGRVTNEGRPARNALMEVRYREVILPPTKKKKKQEVVQDTEAPDSSETPVPPTDKDPQREPVQLWGVHIRESVPPKGMVPDLVGLFFQDRLRSGPKIRFRHTF